MAATEFYPSLGRCVAWPLQAPGSPTTQGQKQHRAHTILLLRLPACLSRCLKSRRCHRTDSIISSRQVWVPLSLCTQSALSGLLGMSIQNICLCLLLTWCISHLRYVALEHQELVKDVVTGLSTLHASCWLFSLHSSHRPFFPGQLS